MLVRDLEALRCPDATIKMRKAIKEFMQGSQTTLELRSIEPSLKRNIEAFNVENGLGLSVSTRTIGISAEQRLTWKENYYEEDYSDVSHIIIHILQRT